MTERSSGQGSSVVESLVALLLGLILLSLTGALLARQRSAQAALSQRMDVLSSARVVRHVVGRELRDVSGAEDAEVHAPDSFRLRAHRGIAKVCGPGAWNELDAEVFGVRLPDPDKDSVLFLTNVGTVHAAALAGATTEVPSRCSKTGGRQSRLTFQDSVPRGVVLVRYFERGGYHLQGGALRYRRGGSGRQPLTAQVFQFPPSGFTTGARGGVGARLSAEGLPAATWTLSLSPSVHGVR